MFSPSSPRNNTACYVFGPGSLFGVRIYRLSSFAVLRILGTVSLDIFKPGRGLNTVIGVPSVTKLENQSNTQYVRICRSRRGDARDRG